jgi:hypothetical protein
MLLSLFKMIKKIIAFHMLKFDRFVCNISLMEIFFSQTYLVQNLTK